MVINGECRLECCIKGICTSLARWAWVERNSCSGATRSTESQSLSFFSLAKKGCLVAQSARPHYVTIISRSWR